MKGTASKLNFLHISNAISYTFTERTLSSLLLQQIPMTLTPSLIDFLTSHYHHLSKKNEDQFALGRKMYLCLPTKKFSAAEPPLLPLLPTFCNLKPVSAQSFSSLRIQNYFYKHRYCVNQI